MKILKKFILVVLAILISYFSVSVAFRSYAREKNEIKFLNEKYSVFDYLNGNFIPFGSDNSWYRTDIGYYNLFGMSVLKTDKDRNIIYRKDILGNDVYIKNEYKLPKFPTSDMTDKLIMSLGGGDKHITITNIDHINDILNALSSFEVSVDKINKDSIVFFAVSSEIGGVFQLNESGSIYKKDNNDIGFCHIISGDLPENVKDIIRLYIDQDSSKGNER